MLTLVCRYVGGETRLVGLKRTNSYSAFLQQLSKATSAVWDEVNGWPGHLFMWGACTCKAPASPERTAIASVPRSLLHMLGLHATAQHGHTYANIHPTSNITFAKIIMYYNFACNLHRVEPGNGLRV
mgnify:CR=1 FL=1